MKKTFAAALLLAGTVLAAHAGPIETLENFIKTARSGKAEFSQVVTGPAREGQAARTKSSTGTLEFQRPNRVRFVYRKPYEQTIVADGQTLWVYDVGLNQVTSRKQAQVLGSTPAALIASAPDLESLKRDFELQALPDKDGLQWVQATPKQKEGQLAHMKVGFRGDQLATLEILDGFGQRSVMQFASMQVNAGVAADAFRFQPPAGADVVKAP